MDNVKVFVQTNSVGWFAKFLYSQQLLAACRPDTTASKYILDEPFYILSHLTFSLMFSSPWDWIYTC